MSALFAFAAGLLFSLGLVLGGMTLPANVIGFLDFFGRWNPALAFVMAGAVGVYGTLFPIVTRRAKPLFSPAFEPPASAGIDGRLLAGAVLFGAGWGLAGICPGPAVTALGGGAPEAAVFAAAMLAGMGLHRLASPAAGSGSGPDGSCG